MLSLESMISADALGNPGGTQLAAWSAAFSCINFDANGRGRDGGDGSEDQVSEHF